MPLIDLKTDLKSLKYGADLPGGGNSGQPYIKVDINTVDRGFNRFRMTKFDDGLVRGGTVGAINASVVDTLRVGKFLKDFPKGPLFIAKQVGLQLSNPQLEHKTNFPTNRPTRGQGLITNIGNFISNVANKILNAVGPTRIYNLGINTLAQVPVNAFGQHIQRHGFTPRRNDDNLYFKVAQHNNNEGNNRLTQLRSILGNVNNINTYISGPSSVYGIGATIIRRRGDFINVNQDTTATEWATTGSFENSSAKNIIATSALLLKNYLGVSNVTSSFLAKIQPVPTSDSSHVADRYPGLTDNINPYQTDPTTDTKNYLELSNKTGSIYVGSFGETLDYPSTLINKVASEKDLYESIPAGKNTVTASNAFGLTDIANDLPKTVDLDQNVIPYTSPKLKAYNDLRKQVNKNSTYKNYNSSNDANRRAVPVSVDRGATDFQYISRELANKFNRENDIDVDQDSLALVFTPLDPFTGASLSTLKFLGYLAEFNESYDSTWNDVKYIGRAEKFYIFNEFKRTASVSFNIPCYNENELLDKHCALSELASSLAGKYDNNLLGGIITRLKLGKYIDNQPGIITNLSFNPIQDSSWDLDLQLAFYLKVTFNFTIIHDFLPQFTPCGFIFNPPKVKPPVKEPKPELPPTPPPPVRSGGGGGGAAPTGSISFPLYDPYPFRNMGNRQFGGFGGGSTGGAGAGGSW